MRTRILMAAALMTGLAGAAWPAASRSDAAITQSVKEKLRAEKEVGARDTRVDTINGIVILFGEVDSAAEKSLAEAVTMKVPGVLGVDNRLVVREGALEAAAAEREAERQDAKERREIERMESGAPKGPGDRLFSRLEDAAITSRVRSALGREPATAALKLNVDTRNGIVTLRGVALSEAEKNLAERYAREVEGVRSVDNRIQVR